MKLDSKILPLVAAVVVLVVAGVLLVGRSLTEPPTLPTGEGAAGQPAPLHPQQIAAREAIRGGRLDEAAELLNSVPPSDPSYLSVLVDLGIVYESMGEAHAALETASRLLALQSEDPEAHFVRARALLLLGRHDEAELSCLRTLELAPNHVRARYTAGLIRVAQAELNPAISAYLRALQLNRDQQVVLEAVADLTRLQQRRPDLADVYYALAFFANTLGSREDEIIELERYLALDPTGPAADVARQKLDTLKGQ